MKTSLKSKLSKLLLGVTLGLGVAVGANQDAMPVHAALTASDISSTAATSVEDGAKYVIASGTSGNVYLAAKGSSTWGTAVAIGSAYEFTAEGSGTSGFALKCKDGYLTPKTSASNTFLAYGSTKVTCSLSNEVIVSGANNSYQLRQNGTSGYRWYSSSTGNVAKLYKINDAKLPLSISGDSTVYNGKDIQLSASSNGTTVSDVTWSSSNTSFATVDNTGKVTGVNGTVAGATVTITAKKTGYEDATKTITVKADTKTLKSISASKAQLTFTLGDSFETGNLEVTGTYSHTNGDPDSQEEIKTGITTSPAVGTKLNTVGPQTVTVNAGGKSTTYSINVNYAAVQSVKLDYEEGTLGKGGEATLPGVTIEPENANPGYSWGNPVATEGILYTYDPSTHELAIDANNTVEGTIQFTATATGDSSKKATVVYTVEAAQIANITGVTASATGTIVAKQYVGDAFNAQGFSFTPTWSEGEHDVVEITANDILWNALVAGSNPTGTYSCADGDFTVTITGVTVVNDTLVSIAFAEGCDMTNKSYYVGDSWDFSGLSIVGTMDSGKTAPAIASSNVTFSSNDAVATDTTSITVTAEYNNLTATKEISGIVVNEVTMDSLTINYTGGQPVLGTNFTFAGSITANMSNGTHPTVNLSDVSIGSVDKFTINQQTITVTHNTTGATGTFNVQYKAAQYLGPAPVPANTILFNEPFTGFSKDAKPGASNSSTTVYGGGSVTYTCTESGTKIYNEALALGTSPELLVAKNGGSFKMAGLPTGSAKVLSFTYACNNGNNAATCDSSAYTMTGGSGSYTLTLKANTTAPATIDITISNSKSSNTRIDDIQLKITTPADRQISDEKHAIKIGDVTCSKTPLIAGETISKSDFKIQVQYDTGTALTSNLTPTSVSPETLVAGTHDYTITYTGSYNDTVTKVIQLTAQAPAVLESISITKDVGCDDVFTRNDTFTHNGIHVIAHYTDSTTYPDADVTANADITPPSDMNVAGTKAISVSYEENGVTKTTSYQITVNPIVSTYLTLSGEGIEGSNGVYTLKSGVENEVQLSFDKDGDETVEFVPGEQSVVTFVNGSLIINSSTTTSEQITVSFAAGTVTATLTVTISAAEGIQLLSDEKIVGYVGSSFSYNINIQLNNVESATWTLPQGDFVIESETEDNTGFVGTIYFTDEVSDTLTFSALTGKGKTLSVDIEVLAVNDDIKSISASLKSGVTYSAGKGQTFSNDDLTVKFERDSGAKGTLASNEFTVSGLPEGSFNRVTSYDLTIASVENTNAKTSLTINVGMPSDLNLNFVTSTTVTEDGEKYWKKVTDLSTISTSKQYVFILEDGANSKIFNGVDDSTADDAEIPVGYINTSVSDGKATYTEGSPYLTINYNSSDATASIKCVGGSNTLAGEYIYGKSGSNGISHGATETFMSFVKEGDDNHIVATSNSTSFRFNATSGNNRFRFFKTTTTGNAYSYPCLYELATKPGDSHLEYSNVNETTDTANKYDFAKLYNFIALANETYADICGSEGNNQKPDLTTWLSVLESAEYTALVADADSYNLLKSAICGEGAYGPDGVYVASGEKQSSDMVIKFLQKYDRVVSNYKTETNYNYLGRDVTRSAPSGLFNNIFGNLGLDVMFNEENAPTSWVLLVTIAVAGLATGGYFYIRKRKED